MLLFRNNSQECKFALVGNGSQPRGYFTLNDDTKYFKGISVNASTIDVDFADEFMGPTTGSVQLTSIPDHVRTIFTDYGSLLQSYIPDKFLP